MAAKTTTRSTNVLPIVSKVYCSPFDVILAVRRRPNVAGGGGFVVADCNQRVVFGVDGCGVIGKKEELILRDGDGNALLLIRRKVHSFSSFIDFFNIFLCYQLNCVSLFFFLKLFLKGGTIEALSLTRKWKGYALDFENSDKLVFTLKEPNSCFSTKNGIRISVESMELCSHGSFEIRGDFPGRSCSIVSPIGEVVALVIN